MSVKVILASVALMFASAANASSVDLQFGGANTTIGNLGSYNINVSGGDPFVGFCIEPAISQILSPLFATYNVSSLGLTNTTPGGIFGQVFKLINTAYFGIAGDAAKTAGFHLALWEITAGDSNVDTKDVDQSADQSAYLSIARDYLAGLDSVPTQGLYEVIQYTNSDYQDYIQINAVPVPAALPLFASGLAGLGFMRRRNSAA